MVGWLRSYLSNRKFKVYLEGVYTQEKEIRSGVPQGAVLSPILFNVLMSDLVKVYGVRFLEFADDLAIFFSSYD